jgi:hypothetical protein
VREDRDEGGDLALAELGCGLVDEGLALLARVDAFELVRQLIDGAREPGLDIREVLDPDAGDLPRSQAGFA